MELIPAKTIISGYHPNTTWFGNNFNMNIYKGCSHGCIYCDSRSECYQVENFDVVRAKENALVLIEQELKSKRRRGILYKMNDIIIGSKQGYGDAQISMFD